MKTNQASIDHSHPDGRQYVLGRGLDDLLEERSMGLGDAAAHLASTIHLRQSEAAAMQLTAAQLNRRDAKSAEGKPRCVHRGSLQL
jgi:hypothetical protein